MGMGVSTFVSVREGLGFVDTELYGGRTRTVPSSSPKLMNRTAFLGALSSVSELFRLAADPTAGTATAALLLTAEEGNWDLSPRKRKRSRRDLPGA